MLNFKNITSVVLSWNELTEHSDICIVCCNKKHMLHRFEFYAKLNDVNSSLSAGVTYTDAKIVQKIMRSLSESFNAKVHLKTTRIRTIRRLRSTLGP